ncbi:MAG: deoxyribodipyrimidine photo-lyase, partial [Rhodospirillaceae bacterium]
MQPILVWFRQDLRLADHAALTAAIDTGAPVIPIYILDDEAAGTWRPGGASRWWLHGSLAALDAVLQKMGSRLTLRRGRAHKVLPEIVKETGSSGVYLTRAYEPFQAQADEALAEKFSKHGLACKRFGGNLLFEPEAARTKAGGPFKVFTPFYKACLALNAVEA